ncbi:ABC transporter ATP-binding protein [Chitinophagaceae bacterium MMS25-I14]
MPDSNTIISADQLRITFAGKSPFTAVHNLSFSLEAGKTLVIVGESGSGKSLTALALMGLLPPGAQQEGTLKLQDTILETLTREQWTKLRGASVGMIFQEPMSALNPVMKIGRQLKESILVHQQVPEHEAKSKAVDWLRRVKLPEPEKIYDRFPHQLSGGQKQRVMIAMAMCNHPVLLIADEPTTALDVTVQKEIIALMLELQQEYHIGLIFITHDLALGSTIADDVLVMYKGEVMEYGDAEQVLHNPRHPYTQALLACRPATHEKGERLPIVSDFWHPEDETEKTEQAAVTASKSAALQKESQVLEVKELNVWFPNAHDWLGRTTGYFKAVKNVSFEINKGEILGLVGESGCGKSTLSRALMGLVPAHSGDILFMNKNLVNATQQEWAGVRKEMQMIFQDPFSSLNPRLSIGQIITEPMRVHHTVPAADFKHEALRLLDLVQLPASAYDRYPHQFSGGQRQRIGIARALALKPQLIICDESVSALDVSIQAQILNLLRDLQQEFQLTYLFISHDLSVVHYLCDRIMVMQHGELVEMNTADEIMYHPQNAYTQKLVDAVPDMK